MSAPISFASWLRRRRKALGLTQHALAARVPCSPSLLRKYESGERRPSPQTAARLAEALALPADQRARFVGLALLNPAEAGHSPATPDDRYPGALPHPPAPLFGRERAAEVAGRLVLGHSGRLVTLLGPPGVGKTRLALQVAADLRPAFADGVCFVALEPLAAAGLVAEQIAQALGVDAATAFDPTQAAISLLRGRHVLLVLDNFEHVIGAAPVVAELLSACPRLHVLATSREALRLRAERRFIVQPLALPASPAEAVSAPAVQLFVERAQAVAPEFSPADVNLIGAICARLDGLPLAIELAAGRCDELTLDALLTHLERRLPLLVDGPRDLPARQQSLRAAIAWSFGLLTPAEADLFVRLGVFADGPTLEAIAAVAAAPLPRVEPLIAALCRKNLVRRLPQRSGPPRFALLETLREYALEQLAAAGLLAESRARLVSHLVAVSESLAGDLPGPRGDAPMQLLDAELNNLRAALAWSAHHDGGLAAARLTVALEQFWTQRGHWSILEQQVVPLLEADLELPPALYARALQVTGYVLSQYAAGRSSAARAVAFFQRSLALSRAAGELRDAGRTLNFLAMMSRYPGNEARTRALLEESLALQRRLGEPNAGTYNQLGMLLTQQGDYAGAEVAFTRGLALATTVEHMLAALAITTNLAESLRRAGHLRRARELFEQVAEQARLRESPALEAEANLGLGRIAATEGDFARACLLVERALARCRELRMRSLLAVGLSVRAQLALLAGEDGAHALTEEALAHGYATFTVEVVAHALVVAAACAAGRRADGEAATLLGIADGLRARFGIPPQILDARVRTLVAPTRARLGPVVFERIRAAAAERLAALVPRLAFDSSVEAMEAIVLERIVAAAALAASEPRAPA